MPIRGKHPEMSDSCLFPSRPVLARLKVCEVSFSHASCANVYHLASSGPKIKIYRPHRGFMSKVLLGPEPRSVSVCVVEHRL